MSPRPRRSKWTQLTIPSCAPANDHPDDALDAFMGDETRVLAPAAPPADAPGNRERAGRAAQRIGDALERWVASYLATAVQAGVLAWWIKIQAGAKEGPVRDRGSGGWRKGIIWTARAAADFAGFTPSGRPVAIECKTVAGVRLYHAAIEPQQLDHLARTSSAGGIALLAVEFRNEGRATRDARQYFIPWHLVPWETARSAPSLTELGAAPWRERAGELLERLAGR